MRCIPSASLIFLTSVLVLAGCESKSQWSPTVDTYGSSRAQYLSRDMEECRALARNASGDTTGQTARGAGIGALAGAADGGQRSSRDEQGRAKRLDGARTDRREPGPAGTA